MSNIMQQIVFVACIIGIAHCFQKFYPSRTVPSAWFQDGSKYLQPISDQDVDFKDNEDLDIAASELNDKQSDHFMGSSYKDVDVERMSDVPDSKRDQITAATGDNHGGRVQIKVYRGPDSGGHHEHFAPYGYWVKQPADYDHH